MYLYAYNTYIQLYYEYIINIWNLYINGIVDPMSDCVLKLAWAMWFMLSEDSQISQKT